MIRKTVAIPVEKVREGMTTYQHGGLRALFGASSRFIRRQSMEPWHLTGEEIYAECSGSVPVQAMDTKTISYDGRFRESLPRQLADIEGEIVTSERAVAEFEDALVFGPGMIVRIDGGYIIPVEVGSRRQHSPNLVKSVSIADVAHDCIGRSGIERELDAAFLLTGERGLPFAHWFYETLPKLRWYERYRSATERNPLLLVPSGLTGWQRDSLALMGYAADSWVEQGTVPTRVKRLAVPPHPYRNRGFGFPGSPATLRWIRNRMLSNLPASDRSSPSRIYVSRTDADRRRVRNEAELMNTLAELGFVKCVLSDLPFADQMRLFAGAHVIVGPHGAGLTNMLYSTDATIIELLTDEGASEHFFVLANELKHTYEFVLCDPASDDAAPPRHRDMVADPAAVRDAIAGL